MSEIDRLISEGKIAADGSSQTQPDNAIDRLIKSGKIAPSLNEPTGKEISMPERIVRSTAESFARIPAVVSRAVSPIAGSTPAESQRTLTDEYFEPGSDVPQSLRTPQGYQQRQSALAQEEERRRALTSAAEGRIADVRGVGQAVSGAITEAVNPIDARLEDLRTRTKDIAAVQARGERAGWSTIGELSSIVNGLGAALADQPDPAKAKEISEAITQAQQVMQYDADNAPNKGVKDAIVNSLRKTGEVLVSVVEMAAPMVATAGGAAGIGKLAKVSPAASASKASQATGAALGYQQSLGEAANTVRNEVIAAGGSEEDAIESTQKVGAIIPAVNAALDLAEIGVLKDVAFNPATLSKANALKKAFAGATQAGAGAVKEGVIESAQNFNNQLASIAALAETNAQGKTNVDLSEKLEQAVAAIPQDVVENTLTMAPISAGAKLGGATIRSASKAVSDKFAAPTTQATQQPQAEQPVDTTPDIESAIPEADEATANQSREALLRTMQDDAAVNEARTKQAETPTVELPKEQADAQTQNTNVVYGLDINDVLKNIDTGIEVDSRKHSVPGAMRNKPGDVAVIVSGGAMEPAADFALPASDMPTTAANADAYIKSLPTPALKKMWADNLRAQISSLSEKITGSTSPSGVIDPVAVQEMFKQRIDALKGKIKAYAEKRAFTIDDATIDTALETALRSRGPAEVETALRDAGIFLQQDAPVLSQTALIVEALRGKLAEVSQQIKSQRVRGVRPISVKNDNVVGFIVARDFAESNPDAVSELQRRGRVQVYDRNPQVVDEDGQTRMSGVPLTSDTDVTVGGQSRKAGMLKAQSALQALLSGATAQQAQSVTPRIGRNVAPIKGVKGAAVMRDTEATARQEAIQQPIETQPAQEVPRAVEERKEPEGNQREYPGAEAQRQITEAERGDSTGQGREVKEEVAPVDRAAKMQAAAKRKRESIKKKSPAATIKDRIAVLKAERDAGRMTDSDYKRERAALVAEAQTKPTKAPAAKKSLREKALARTALRVKKRMEKERTEYKALKAAKAEGRIGEEEYKKASAARRTKYGKLKKMSSTLSENLKAERAKQESPQMRKAREQAAKLAQDAGIIADLERLVPPSDNIEIVGEVQAEKPVQKMTRSFIRAYLPRAFKRQDPFSDSSKLRVAFATGYVRNGKQYSLDSKAVVFVDPMGKTTVIINPKNATPQEVGALLAHELLGHAGAEYLLRQNRTMRNEAYRVYQKAQQDKSDGKSGEVVRILEAIEVNYKDQIDKLKDTPAKLDEFIYSEFIGNAMEAWAIGKLGITSLPVVPNNNTFLSKLFYSHPDLYYALQKVGQAIVSATKVLPRFVRFMTGNKLPDESARRLFAEMVLSGRGIRNVADEYIESTANTLVTDPNLYGYMQNAAKLVAARDTGALARQTIDFMRRSDSLAREGLQVYADKTIASIENGSLTEDQIAHRLKRITSIAESYASRMGAALAHVKALQAITPDTETNQQRATLDALEDAIRTNMTQAQALVSEIMRAAKRNVAVQISDIAQAYTAAPLIQQYVENNKSALDAYEKKVKKETGKSFNTGAWDKFQSLVDDTHLQRKLVQFVSPEIAGKSGDWATRRTLVQPAVQREQAEAERTLWKQIENHLASNNITMNDFSTYITMKAAIDRNALVKGKGIEKESGSGISDVEAIAYMDRLKNRNPEKYKALEEGTRWTKQAASLIRQNAVRSGIVTTQQAARWEKDQPNYVPFTQNLGQYAVGSSDTIDQQVVPSINSYRKTNALNQNKPWSKPAEGRFSKPDMGATLTALREAHMASIERAYNAEIANEMLKWVKNNPEAKSIIEIEPLNKEQELELLDTEDTDGSVAVRSGMRMYGKGSNRYLSIIAYDNGKKYRINVKNVPLAVELASIDFDSNWHPVYKKAVAAFGVIKNLKASMLTRFSAAFAAKEVFRNTAQAAMIASVKAADLARSKGASAIEATAISAKVKAQIVANTAKYLPAAYEYSLAHTGDYTLSDYRALVNSKPIRSSKQKLIERMATSGATNILGYTDRKAVDSNMQKNIEQIAEYRRAQDKGVWSKLPLYTKSSMVTAKKMLESLTSAADLAVRMATWEVLESTKYKGKNVVSGDTQLADLTQQATINFQVSGRLTRLLGKYMMFIRPVVYSMRKVFSLAKSKQGRLEAGALMAAGALIAMMNAEDDEDEIPFQAYLAGLPIKIGEGFYVSIPMGGVWGLWAGLGAAMSRYALNTKRGAENSYKLFTTEASKAITQAGVGVLFPFDAEQMERAYKSGPIEATIMQTGMPFVSDALRLYSNTQYNGAPIYPTKWQESDRWRDTYFQSASWPAIRAAYTLGEINESLDVSPNMLDFTYGALLSSTGRELAQITDMATKVAYGDKADIEPHRAFMLSAFYRKIPESYDYEKALSVKTNTETMSGSTIKKDLYKEMLKLADKGYSENDIASEIKKQAASQHKHKIFYLPPDAKVEFLGKDRFVGFIGKGIYDDNNMSSKMGREYEELHAEISSVKSELRKIADKRKLYNQMQQVAYAKGDKETYNEAKQMIKDLRAEERKEQSTLIGIDEMLKKAWDTK